MFAPISKIFHVCKLKAVIFSWLLIILPSCKSENQKKEIVSSTGDNEILNSLAAVSSESKMIWIGAGSFFMGSNNPDFPDAQPVHTVTINGFWIDEHEVTNSAFANFVKKTGYVTVAERPLNPADYPEVPVGNMIIGSIAFSPPQNKVSLDDPRQWWRYVEGANWMHPTGPNSSVVGKPFDPVVQICYEDAETYAKWAGKRLPTEAEWEYAARAGQLNQNYYWGTELKPGGKWMANIFQGSFPDRNSLEDGFETLAPVKSFPPNAYGLYDMEGNVWEWCSDYYRPDYYKFSSKENPKGPADSYDPDEPGVEKRVQRGGSFLCSDQYCIRYKTGSRGKGEVKSASNNLGFRCVKDSTRMISVQ